MSDLSNNEELTLPPEEELTLRMKGFFAQTCIDPRWIQVSLDYHLENQAYMLQTLFRPYVDILQEDRVVAEYPTNWWQHTRKVLGLPYKKRQVKASEFVLFPDMDYPPSLGEPRIHFQVVDLPEELQ